MRKIKIEVDGFKDTILSESRFLTLFSNIEEVLCDRKNTGGIVWLVEGLKSTRLGWLSFDAKEKEWILIR